MSQDDPSTKKYHQIVVPDHALKPNTGGTSFLRTGTFPSLTDATKQPPGFQTSLELARLAGDHHLKTGGSWHHVDGNRIETTTGRKVEVIAGSYVAHRGPGNSPGPNFSATWATTSYTQVGSLDLPVGSTPGTPVVAPPLVTADPTTDFVSRLSFNYNTSFDRPSNASVDANPPGSSLLQPGDVAAVTWAQRIMTYVGSVAAPVQLVYAETWANSMHSYSYYSVESLTYVGTNDHQVPKVLARTDAGTIDTRSFAHTGDLTTWNHSESGSVFQDTMSARTIVTTQEAAISIDVFNTAPILTTLNTGIQAVVNIGVVGTFTIGPNVVMNLPSFWNFTLDETGFKAASADMTLEQQRMTAVRQRLDAIKTQLASTVQDVTAVSNTIAGTHTSLAATRTHLGQIATYLNALTALGP